MTDVVLLDSGPLGLATNPKPHPEATACSAWLLALSQRGIVVYVPEIADYEMRRELLRAGKQPGLARLDLLISTYDFLPLQRGALRRAAQLWADTRRAGQPTADDKALDGDVILAAQAQMLLEALNIADPSASHNVIVATTNVGHFRQFVDGRLWRDI